MHFPLNKVTRFSPLSSAGNEVDRPHISTISVASPSSYSSGREEGAQYDRIPKPGRYQEEQPAGQRTHLRNSGGIMRKLKKKPAVPHLKIDSSAANSYYRPATSPETPTTASTALSSILVATPLTADYIPPLSPGGIGKNLDYAFPPFPTAKGGVMPNVYRLAGFDYYPSTQQMHLQQPHGQSAGHTMPPRKDSKYAKLRKDSSGNKATSDILPQIQQQLSPQRADLVPKRPAPKAPSTALKPLQTDYCSETNNPIDGTDRLWIGGASSTSRTSPSSSSPSSLHSAGNESNTTSVDEDAPPLEQSPAKLRILSQLQAEFTATRLHDHPARGVGSLVEFLHTHLEESSTLQTSLGSLAKLSEAKISDKAKCHGCGLPILGKSISSVDGRVPGKWHRNCFKCTACRSPFPTGEFYVLESMPYCARDYHLQNGSICAVCGEGVEGECLELEDATDEEDGKRITEEMAAESHGQKRVHMTCFRCWECRVLLEDEYYEMQGRYLCEVHATQAYNKIRGQLCNFTCVGVDVDSQGRDAQHFSHQKAVNWSWI
ncbi:uncharacterized protein V1513DRAFT_383804 [Lipomyces chichibuensis]|uniref:uncharacterized protein n=1 Tax=Lipomyces chichibuensis TaxID=1546026 RepID=UPI0033430ED2